MPKIFRKALLIGLGGSGQKVLVNLKRLLIDECGMVPPCIRFLALDTDNQRDTSLSLKTGKEIQLSPEEFIHMAVADPVTFINMSKAVQSWFIDTDRDQVSAILAGSGAVRENGRLGFYSHINDIYVTLERAWTGLSRATLSGQMKKAGFELIDQYPEVCATGSLAGGTGSGTFLDVGIMCRELTGESTIITGIFLLPWIYRHKGVTTRTPSNTYAAMCELDAVLSRTLGPDHNKPFTVNHRDATIKATTPPYNLFHLIDGRNEYGENIDDPDALASCIAQAIFLNLGAEGEKAGSHIDNLRTVISAADPNKWEHKSARYTSFGVSSLVYPAKEYHSRKSLEEAVKLLDCAVQECSESGGAVPVTDEVTRDVRRFALENHLARDNMHELREEVFRIDDLDTRFEFDESFSYNDKNIWGVISDLRSFHIDNIQSQIEARVGQNAPRLTNELCGKVVASIDRFRSEEKQGRLSPSFALAWTETLEATIDGNREATVLEEASVCGNELKQMEGTQEFHKRTIETAPYGIFRRQRRAACANFAEIITEEATLRAKRAQYQQVAKICEAILEVVRTRLEELRQQVAGASDVVGELGKVRTGFRKQIDSLNAEEQRRRKNPFEIFVGKANTLYYPEGETLPEITYDGFKRDCKIASASDYLGKKSEELGSLFLDYTKERFNLLLNVGLEEVLQRVEQDRPGYTAECAHNLLRLSSALWRYRRGYITQTRASTMFHIVVCGTQSKQSGIDFYQPYIDSEKVAMNITDDVSWVSTGDPHRVTMLQYAASVPFFVLEDLDKYRRMYETILMPSSHIDKQFQFDVPDIFPEKAVANLALRVVTLGIIKGIDAIQDKKLLKGEGHEYTINHPDINVKYDPIVHRDFVSLYDYMLGNTNAVTVLAEEVAKRCEAMPPEALKSAFEEHLKKMQERFKSVDFNKQITGRFYSREISILKNLLDDLDRGGNVRAFINS